MLVDDTKIDLQHVGGNIPAKREAETHINCVYRVHSMVCNNNFPYARAFILQEAKSRHNTLINIQSYLFSPLYCTKAQALL